MGKSVLLDAAVARISALPPAMQDEAARMLLAYAGADRPVIQLTPAEEAELDAADAEVALGSFATDEEVAAILDKYRQ